MPPLLNRAEANLESTVPDSRMRNAEVGAAGDFERSADDVHEDGRKGTKTNWTTMNASFSGRCGSFGSIMCAQGDVATRKELTDLPEAARRPARPRSKRKCWPGCPGWRASVRRRKTMPICPRSSRPWTSCRPIRKRAVVLRRIIGHTKRNRRPRFARWTSGPSAIASRRADKQLKNIRRTYDRDR